MQTNDLSKIGLFEIELFDHWIACKQITDVIIFTNHIYLIYMNKPDLAMVDKTKPRLLSKAMDKTVGLTGLF